MKLYRSLSIRILVVSVLSGAVGLASATTSARYATDRLASNVIGDWLKRGGVRQKARCEEHPEQWVMGPPSGPHIFAYDAETLTSHNPDAPPLDRAVYARLSPAMNVPTEPALQAPLLDGGSAIQIRLGTTGPCAVLQAILPERPADRGTLVAAFAGVLGAVLAAAALAFFMVVRPLAARVGRLSVAANRVGDPSGYAPAQRAAADELDRVAAALDRAHARIRADAQHLEERRRDLERHLADVAHDLRTPLTSLQLAIEQAADQVDDGALADVFAGALRDCVYLAGLVNNLRLATQLKDGWDPLATAPEDFADLKDVVERVVARLASLARRRGIELAHATPDEAVRVRCNPLACEQAIGNLVENAVSHGDRGGHVAVVLEATPEGSFCLTVVDDGPGVSQAEIPRLGERTFRSDEARQRDPRGSGLGLAITGEVCRRAGFALAFAPAGPRGLEVTVRGSPAPRASRGRAHAPSGEGSARGLTDGSPSS